mmetsp:Transcript_79888/g.234991  ORF Transcript_79888/g.234991 Transcript_79888/m.234991 type:complete len:233 (-) Transcript_79888:71-769(-)
MVHEDHAVVIRELGKPVPQDAVRLEGPQLRAVRGVQAADLGAGGVAAHRVLQGDRLGVALGDHHAVVRGDVAVLPSVVGGRLHGPPLPAGLHVHRVDVALLPVPEDGAVHERRAVRGRGRRGGVPPEQLPIRAELVQALLPVHVDVLLVVDDRPVEGLLVQRARGAVPAPLERGGEVSGAGPGRVAVVARVAVGVGPVVGRREAALAGLTSTACGLLWSGVSLRGKTNAEQI